MGNIKKAFMKIFRCSNITDEITDGDKSREVAKKMIDNAIFCTVRKDNGTPVILINRERFPYKRKPRKKKTASTCSNAEPQKKLAVVPSTIIESDLVKKHFTGKDSVARINNKEVVGKALQQALRDTKTGDNAAKGIIYEVIINNRKRFRNVPNYRCFKELFGKDLNKVGFSISDKPYNEISEKLRKMGMAVNHRKLLCSRS